MTMKRRVIADQGIELKSKDKSLIQIDSRKTIAMLNIELATGETIEAWLASGYSLRTLGNLLNVHHTTIIKWRKKFKLNGS
jgi:hypothetical protein